MLCRRELQHRWGWTFSAELEYQTECSIAAKRGNQWAQLQRVESKNNFIISMGNNSYNYRCDRLRISFTYLPRIGLLRLVIVSVEEP